MYHHIKELMYRVEVGMPDPAFGNMLLEQFGGANGELAAAMQYSVQGMNCDDPERKDMLMDIGTEELSHLEVVGALARFHLRPLKNNRKAAEVDPLIAIAGGGGPLWLPANTQFRNAVRQSRQWVTDRRWLADSHGPGC